MHRILVVDDEKDICLLISGILEDEGYEVKSAHTAHSAYNLIDNFSPDLIIQDIWLQDSSEDGIDVLKNTIKQYPAIPFLMISGHGTIETAVSSIKEGAYDFIEKPFKSDRLLLMIDRALETAELKKQNTVLTEKARKEIVGLSKFLPDHILSILNKCKDTNSRVLITGEVGTGKSIAADYLHYNSDKADEKLIRIDCRQDNFQNLLPSQTFGTIVLDEVHSLNFDDQSFLHEFLKNTKLRIISTSSSNLKDCVERKTFQEDLFYRLNVVHVDLVPLRNRKKELSHLIAARSDFVFSDMAMSRFLSYNWPGNIKQLQNVMEWISIINTSGSDKLCIEDLPPEINGRQDDNTHNNNRFSIDDGLLELPLRDARESFERYYLLTQVHKFGGNISKTAAFIGMERSALHRKLKSLEVFSDDQQDVA